MLTTIEDGVNPPRRIAGHHWAAGADGFSDLVSISESAASFDQLALDPEALATLTVTPGLRWSDDLGPDHVRW
jgi:hypothetical protein